MDGRSPVVLVVEPEGLELRAVADSALADELRAAGIAVNYPCGGRGRCGTCRVRFVEGAPAPTSVESDLLDPSELADGVRLACRCRLAADAAVEVPRASRVVEPKILTASEHARFPLDPAVVKRVVRPELPTVERPIADLEIIADILGAGRDRLPQATPAFLRKLPTALRSADGATTVVERGGLLLDAEPGDTSADIFGIAVDLGTTTIAASLHSLRTGEQLAIAACVNPQVQAGEDVISRINRTFRNRDGLLELQTLAARGIDSMVHRLCASAGVRLDSVYEIAVAGNAAMNHLLLGVPPESIALAPYAPVFRIAPEAHARALGISGNEEARLLALPNIGGFVGGDTVAGLLLTDLARATETSLLIDIGTNCEVVLVHEGRMLAASAPAGPAMEGACIEFGMRAEPGAIDDVGIEDGGICARTIDGEPARGLCGSGLVHAIAALRAAGILEPSGLFASSSCVDRPATGGARVLLAARSAGARRDVWLTQRDVREFQLARAAIAGAWKTLCAIAGVEPDDVRRVFVAGAFGNYIRSDAAMALGLTPSGPRADIRGIGNSSLEGARMVLLDLGARARALQLPSQVEFIELAGREGFDEMFALELALGQ